MHLCLYSLSIDFEENLPVYISSEASVSNFQRIILNKIAIKIILPGKIDYSFLHNIYV